MSAERQLCRLCETRRPRRYCPGVSAEICTVCCGTEREVTVACPFDCEYLQQARKHEARREVAPETLLHPDIRITESFLERANDLLMFLGRTLLEGAANVPGAVDNDVREALESLIRTYRTLESGLVYESRPANPLASAILDHLKAGVQHLREEISRNVGIQAVRDSEVLGVVVFLRRIEDRMNNGRTKGRAFLHYLYDLYQDHPNPPGTALHPGSPGGSSGLIIP